LRAMRVAAAPVQLAMPMAGVADADQRWWGLPEVARMQVLALLARLIARSVLIEGATGQPAAGLGAGDE
jgi:hypothetical protein